jgi:formate dehydrogenase alpha subunit
MVCPTGALTSRPSKGLGRSYEVEQVKTTCTYCGTGCSLALNVKNDRVVGVSSVRGLDESPVNQGALCVKGRFGWDFIHHSDRLTTPLIRIDGELVPATWDEALDFAAGRLTEIRGEFGPDSMAVFASARATNDSWETVGVMLIKLI